MLSKPEVAQLLTDLEPDRVERTTSFREDKVGPAICAFSNDYPNHKQPGYLFFGVNDNGSLAGLTITDHDLQSIGAVRANGNVLPQPSVAVSEVYQFDGGQVVVAEVQPAFHPPVRYRGKCYIRVGPRKAVANETEERRLAEKRTWTTKTFDARPLPGVGIDVLDQKAFQLVYLPTAFDDETIAANNRTIEAQMASLRLYDPGFQCATAAGVLLLHHRPMHYLPGAFIQYVKFDGNEITDRVGYEKRFMGPLYKELENISQYIQSSIIKSRPVRAQGMQEVQLYNYPLWALRELVMNAIMHRDYESNAPIYIYEYANRIEIVNSGGLYGEARPENFPNTSDYRNPVLAEVIKNMGYINRFNFGIRNAQKTLASNGNPPAVFDLSLITKFHVTIPIHTQW